MKQPEDTRTLELPMLDPAALTPTSSKDVEVCEFHIITSNGEIVQWKPLTRTKARQMYNYTEKHQPPNVQAFGWSVMP